MVQIRQHSALRIQDVAEGPIIPRNAAPTVPAITRFDAARHALQREAGQLDTIAEADGAIWQRTDLLYQRATLGKPLLCRRLSGFQNVQMRSVR